MTYSKEFLNELKRSFTEVVSVSANNKDLRARAIYSVYLVTSFRDINHDYFFYSFTAQDLSKVLSAEFKIQTILFGKKPTPYPLLPKYSFFLVFSKINSLVNDIRNALISDIKLNNEKLTEDEARKIFSIFQQLVKDLNLTEPKEVPHGTVFVKDMVFK